MRQVLSSGVFPRIQDAVQHAITGEKLHIRVSKALSHLAPILYHEYEPHVEKFMVVLRSLIDDPMVVHLNEGPHFSAIRAQKLKHWINTLLRLYGLACFELHKEPEMSFFLDFPDKSDTTRGKRRK